MEVEAWKKKSPSDITDLLSIQERLRELLPDAKKALVSIEAGDGAGSGVIVSKEVPCPSRLLMLLESQEKLCKFVYQTENEPQP